MAKPEAFLVPVGDEAMYLVTVMELEPPPADMTEDPTPPPLLDMFILPPETPKEPPVEPDTNSEDDPNPAKRSSAVAELATVEVLVEMLELLILELELFTIELPMGPADTLSSRTAPGVKDKEPSKASTTDPAPELLVAELPDEEAIGRHENNFNQMTVSLYKTGVIGFLFPKA